MDSHAIAREIRSRFRSLMDGVVSENMRNIGAQYHVNWGVSLLHLKDLAKDYAPDLHVSLELWQDNVRESKIVALLLMPVEEFTPDIAGMWADDIKSQEIAEMAAMLLFSKVPYAPEMAYKLIAQEDSVYQILGYNILSRLFADGKMPDVRGLEELMDQIRIALKDDSPSVRHSAYNCFLKLDTCDKLADSPYWHALCKNIE
ncbi:MAG: DNA alkylation repair protein [Bacteroidales bacterium]|nr:DNA alkylation repair protein [Bacteroidales bacterium]MCM1147402.1 DNA alkylation repair protein [Bacteroidales bacterium]MCM1206071.1 DNA alkylation repair protein [Bacillota bacterium]MCM1510098.1 DNA alkylation repair protein [Clostridium sp.]